VSKQYDATLNLIIDEESTKWGNYLISRTGIPQGTVSFLDSDLSSTLQADKLFLVEGPSPAILHLELESSSRLGIPAKLLRYNVAAQSVHKLPVHSIVMLLRPIANATDLPGYYEVFSADGLPYLTFRDTVLRIWEESIDHLLAAGAGLAPLALLTNEAAADLPIAFSRLRERLHADDVPDTLEHKLLGAAYVLCGLRYEQHQVDELYQELNMILEDSTTYQAIIRKGQVKEAHSIILRQGAQRFGQASEQTASIIGAISDQDHLERIIDRILNATGWEDLITTT
jgi:hypothetical protein